LSLEENQIMWNPEFVLKLEHFKGDLDTKKPHHANTNVNLFYEFRHLERKTPSRFKGKILEIRVYSFVNLSKCWIKDEVKNNPNLSLLLKHEQGHFDLAEECARLIEKKMNKRFKGRSFSCKSSSKDGRIEEIKKILDKEFLQLTNNFLRKMDKKYDEDTNYGRQISFQEKYNERFSKLRMNDS